MGNAKKCDKCGDLYENPTYPLDDMWSFRVMQYFNTLPEPEKQFDLCPDCQRKLVDWLWDHSKSDLK